MQPILFPDPNDRTWLLMAFGFLTARAPQDDFTYNLKNYLFPKEEKGKEDTTANTVTTERTQ